MHDDDGATPSLRGNHKKERELPYSFFRVNIVPRNGETQPNLANQTAPNFRELSNFHELQVDLGIKYLTSNSF